MYGKFESLMVAWMVSFSCEWLLAWRGSVMGATCMVCLSCEWLHAWDVSVVVVCMHGVFEL